MALPQAVKDVLKNTYKFDVDKLIDAVKADAEVAIDIPSDVTVLKTTELETRDTNKVNEGKTTGMTEGEKKGKELASKAFKKKFGLEDSLPNDPDKVVEAVNEKLNKGDVALKEQVTALLKDKETLAAEKELMAKETQAAKQDARLISLFPSKRSGDLKDDERLLLMKKDLTIEVVDGKEIVKKNGQIVQDPATHAPLPVEKVIDSYFTDRKWVAAAAGDGGRGGGDGHAGGGAAGVKTLTKFTEKWKAENPGMNEVSPEFHDALGKHMKDTPDFDTYN